MAKVNRPRQILESLKSWLLIAALFSFSINILVLVSPLYSFQVFDRVLSSSHIGTLVYLTIAAMFAFIVMSFIDSLRTCLLTRVGTRFEREIAPELVQVAVDTATSQKPVGIQPLRDLGQIRNFVGGPLIAPLFDAPWTPFFTIVLWFVHPWLGILTLVFAALLFGLALANHKMQRVPAQAASVHLATAYRLAEAAVRHGETVQAMGLFPNIMARWRASAEYALQVQETAADRGAIISGISKFVRLIAQILVLGLGAYLVLTGQMTGGGMIAGSMILGRALMPVEQSISAWRQFITARQAYQSIVAAFDGHNRPSGETKLPVPSGQIELERVVFQPNPSYPAVIKGVSMTVNAGEMLGVIGPSASGKSTICKLMIGILRPNAGYVRLDGADLTLWRHEELGPHLGYLPQLVELFTGSVAENIARMGRPDSGAVVEAAKMAGVHDLILRLPAGYDTPVGEGGVQLSGGQRQRIGLARALFGHPKILLLDEPNANLDAEGEVVLIQALERLKKLGTTIIVVAHRPQILTPADRLLIMTDGQVSMLGPKDEVMARISSTPSPAAAKPALQQSPQARPAQAQPNPQAAAVAPQMMPQQPTYQPHIAAQSQYAQQAMPGQQAMPPVPQPMQAVGPQMPPIPQPMQSVGPQMPAYQPQMAAQSQYAQQAMPGQQAMAPAPQPMQVRAPQGYQPQMAPQSHNTPQMMPGQQTMAPASPPMQPAGPQLQMNQPGIAMPVQGAQYDPQFPMPAQGQHYGQPGAIASQQASVPNPPPVFHAQGGLTNAVRF